MIDRSDHVRITSTKETILSRWNGVDYVFKPNDPVDVPTWVAAHIFGFGSEDKSNALARLGWAQSSDQIPAALERLKGVKFGASPALVDAPEPAPAADASAGERMPNRTPSGAPIAGGGKAAGVAQAPAAEPHRGR